MSGMMSDVFPNYDPRTQLDEIGRLLDCIFTWRNELRGTVEEKRQEMGEATSGSIDHHLAHDTYNSLGWHSICRDAACSQAAVGALAPFVEGLLVHVFRYLGECIEKSIPRNVHHRWKLDSKEFWDPHVVSENGAKREEPDLVRGTCQIFKALQLQFGTDPVESLLKALFTYRNRVLHHGYEWPLEECEKFIVKMRNENWDKWFGVARADGKPWIVYANDTFVSMCVKSAHKLLGVFHDFAKQFGGRVA
jgi:hypothetical protein